VGTCVGGGVTEWLSLCRLSLCERISNAVLSQSERRLSHPRLWFAPKVRGPASVVVSVAINQRCHYGSLVGDLPETTEDAILANATQDISEKMPEWRFSVFENYTENKS